MCIKRQKRNKLHYKFAKIASNNFPGLSVLPVYVFILPINYSLQLKLACLTTRYYLIKFLIRISKLGNLLCCTKLGAVVHNPFRDAVMKYE